MLELIWKQRRGPYKPRFCISAERGSPERAEVEILITHVNKATQLEDFVNSEDTHTYALCASDRIMKIRIQIVGHVNSSFRLSSPCGGSLGRASLWLSCGSYETKSQVTETKTQIME
ncbi:hypothetical protein Fmac_008955 [Flemingia macrophylla]|uniref:Uncharacterized protein n=1 Tax=Flemingia macrophylla TaxID=520843 RepID=A0ABD1N1B2_9FABA